MMFLGSDSKKRTGSTSRAASHVEYQWITDGTYVHLLSWPVNWAMPFQPEGYTLPFRNTQSTPFRRNLIVRYPDIPPCDFFNFVSQFGPVYRAAWKKESAIVTFLSKGHTDQCFDELVEKGYTAAVGAPFSGELWVLNQM